MMKRLSFFILAIATLLAVSCSDEEFSTGKSDLLDFSTDTLRMDTLFSGVPSPTYSFMVYNNGDKGLRIRQVRLQKGNQTGFRVNVDGVFLDNSNGSQAQDFEIRGGDSLRVFVELTSYKTYSDDPQHVEDNLLFMLESGTEQRVCLSAFTWDAVELRNFTVSRDTTIMSEKPIVVYGGIKVDSCATLTIKSPTRLYFHPNAGIDVFGKLVVEGKANDEVVLRGDRLDHIFDYLPYDRLSGQWSGIRFRSSSTGNSISFADIHSTNDAIVCDSAALGTCRLRLENTTLHNCNGYGLRAVNSHISLVNCQITNTLGDCVSMVGGRLELTYCTVAQFYPFSVNRGAAISFGNTLNGVVLNERGSLICVNTAFTGYAEDVVMGDSLSFDYHFLNCLLRTPAVSDSLRFQNVIFESPKDSIQGEKHFRLVDIDLQDYDFHLDSLSTLRGKAMTVDGITDNRDGTLRGDTLNIGCY